MKIARQNGSENTIDQEGILSSGASRQTSSDPLGFRVLSVPNHVVRDRPFLLHPCRGGAERRNYAVQRTTLGQRQNCRYQAMDVGGITNVDASIPDT